MIPEDPLTEPIQADPLVEPTTQPIPKPATKPTVKPAGDDEANAKKSAIGGILAALQQHEEDHTQTPEVESSEEDTWTLIDKYLSEYPEAMSAEPADSAKDYLQWVSEQPERQDSSEEPEETPEEEPEEGGEHTYEDDDTSHETGTPIERPLTESPVETIDDGGESKPYDAQGEDNTSTVMDTNDGLLNAHNNPVYSRDPMDMSTLTVTDDGIINVGGQEVQNDMLF